ncbi:MAG: Uma2 family endonuclease [Bacteroidota bacterium]
MPKKYDLPEDNIDDITLLEPTASYSYADYLRWTFEERVEIIKGKFFNMSPAPIRIHQEVSVNLLTIFSNYLKGKKCKVYHAPFDVRLPNKQEDPFDKIQSVVQPDLCIVCNDQLLDDKGCNGAPDLIVEIISPSTKNRDLNQKYQLYQENKVKEYWIAYPSEEQIDVFLLDSKTNRYLPALRYRIGDQIPINLFDGYTLNCTDIFG